MNKPLLLALVAILVSNLSLAQAPVNDNCAGAISQNPITGTGATARSLWQATSTGIAPTYGTTAYDVWYMTTIPAGRNTITIAIPSSGSALNANNLFIEAYNATSCGAVTADNSIAVGVEGTGTKGITLSSLTPGSTYYFRVYTSNNPNTGASGDWSFNLLVQYSTTASPNNECASAVTLTVGASATGTLLNATASASIPAACSGTPDDDVWFRFSATQNYAIVTVAPATSLDNGVAMVQVFSGTCGSLVSIGCGRESVKVTGLTATTTYFIRVFSAVATGTAVGGALTNGQTFTIAVTPGAAVTGPGSRMNEVFEQTILSETNILSDPWEVTYGPDNYLWVTEAKGNKVYRIDPNTGERTTVLDISPNSPFFSSPTDKAFNLRTDHANFGAQGGLAGLAIHPDFQTATDKYVFISYVYQWNTSLSGNAGNFFTNRIVRFKYNTSTGLLEQPKSVCDTLPGSNDHNSQRMIIAPVNGVNYLFYAAGDMGAGQYANTQRPIKSQIVSAYEGKILRFNVDEDGNTNAFDKWIPDDNPYNVTTPVAKQSAVWSTGIRNNQGFAFGKINGVETLYGSSHGPYSDDELNILKRAINYGHPNVIGKRADGNYNNASAGVSGSSMPVITNENDYATNTIGLANYGDPIYSFYDASSATIQNIYTTQPPNSGWPSEGICGMEIYTKSLIPDWRYSLFLGTLKGGKVTRMKLEPNGQAVIAAGAATEKKDTINYFRSQNRFRDVAFAPDGKTIFTIIDKSQTTSGPTTGNPIISACAGCLQKNRFLGYEVNTGSADRSTIRNIVPVSPGKVDEFEKANQVVINAANGNTNVWVPITDTNSNIVAEIYARGQDLDTITTYTYKVAGPASRLANGQKYANRHFTITPQKQPGSMVSIRLYLTKTEGDNFIADASVAAANMKILKNPDSCETEIVAHPALATTTVSELFGTNNGYVLQGNINSFSSFFIAGALITLPVDLVSFTGTLKGNDGDLRWETASETNSSHYILERSIDGTNYSEIANIAASGNSSSTTKYSYLDKNIASLAATHAHYRLKQVDIDNGYSYSNVVVIALPSITTINVTPNPVNTQARVQLGSPADVKATWLLTDNGGRVVMQGSENLKRGNNQFLINMSKLSGGVYYLNVKGTGISHHVKVQKQ
jgi:trimeric autotransporter adhesin